MHSRDENSYVDQPKEIIATFNRAAHQYSELVTEFETFKVTSEHPLWIQGKGWTEVKDIKGGDAIASVDGDVLVIHNELINKKIKVYNFSVIDTPNYFVGKSRIWVHNAPCEVGFQVSGKNPELNNPKPNSRYYVDGRSTFITDAKGRTTKVNAKITENDIDANLRDCYRTRKVGNCGLPGDDGGHLTANKLGGPGEEINLVPQNMNLNRSRWKAMENE